MRRQRVIASTFDALLFTLVANGTVLYGVGTEPAQPPVQCVTFITFIAIIYGTFATHTFFLCAFTLRAQSVLVRRWADFASLKPIFTRIA